MFKIVFDCFEFSCNFKLRIADSAHSCNFKPRIVDSAPVKFNHEDMTRWEHKCFSEAGLFGTSLLYRVKL